MSTTAYAINGKPRTTPNRLIDMTPRTPAPAVAVETVTPDLATAWLATTEGNRTIDKRRVEQYARDMRAGKWMLVGDAVTFNTAGTLKNAHHRLRAVILAGVPVQMLVLRNMPDDAADVQDSGRARTYADVLRMNGTLNSVLFSGTLSWLFRYDTNQILSPETGSHREKSETAARHPMVATAVAITTSMPAGIKCAPVAFVLTIATERLPREAERFAEYLRYGTNFPSEHHPVRRLRDRLMARRESKAKLPPIEICALTVKAWNAMLMGQELKHLRWRREGDAAENFPAFLG